MGVSEVLLCPYRCLEYKMVRLEKLKIQLCFYSRFLIILLPNRISVLVMPSVYLSSLFLNELSEGAVTTERKAVPYICNSHAK